MAAVNRLRAPRPYVTFALFLALAGLGIGVAYCLARPSDDPETEEEADTEAWKADLPKRDSAELELGPDKGPIRCRLRRDSWLRESDGMTVELTNLGGSPVRLWTFDTPRLDLGYHVRILARSRRTNKVTGFSGIRAGPGTGIVGGKAPVLVLQPGETHVVKFSLEYVRRGNPGMNGRRHLEAVFTYDNLGGYPASNQHYFARSNAVNVGR